MAKRFIDTDIFKKQFIRSLEAPYKLLWVYVLSDCNYAGIWEVDFEVAELRLGVKIEKNKALEFFKDKIALLNNGAKWFIPDFIIFQYAELKDNNKAHKNIISVLKKENLLNEDLTLKGLPSPLQRAMEKEKDKEKEMDKEMETEKEGQPEAVLWPDFEDFWNLYDKKVDRKPCEKKWNGLKQEEKEKIIEYLPEYILSTPDKQFRKDPETFFNRRSWENEIIKSNGKQQNTDSSNIGAELDELIAAKYNKRAV